MYILRRSPARDAWDLPADAPCRACEAAHGQPMAKTEALRRWTGPSDRGIVGATGVDQEERRGDMVGARKGANVWLR